MSDLELPYASVILDRAVNKPLDYAIPDSLRGKIKPGLRVKVPIKNKEHKGTILALLKTSSYPILKPIIEVLNDQDVLCPDLFELANWMSRYYCTPLTKTLSAILPSSVRKDLSEKSQYFVKSALSKGKLIEHCEEIRLKSPKQAAVIDIMLAHPKGLFLSQLIELDGITKSPIETLVKKEILLMEKVVIDRSILEEEEFFPSSPKKLYPEQEGALTPILESLEKGLFRTHLIHGITGSGKTEVYLRAIEAALSMGKGVIMLVPEIALTAQTIERFKARFQTKMAILHHRLSDGERFDSWHKIRKGEIPIVIGARSAVFSPMPNLGLILIDEEQESSYKQIDEMPCYHARDVGIMRAKILNCPVILGSATPSLETYHNALTGKFVLSKMTTRAGHAKRPKVTIVDMKRECEKAGGFTLFSDLLLTKIEQKMKAGEQTILFLNRRGYFKYQVCQSCNKTLMCSHCDISLTYHRGENLLSCHICGFTVKAPVESCFYCGSKETLKFKGPGTEQVERALHAIFPDIRTLRMDRDTTRHKGSHDKLFKQFRSGKADVLIGTQMIAKGLHFPAVTLVGVLSADSALNIPDFRANEHLFSLITQVSGRSGRSTLEGEVILQAFQHDHPIIKLASKEDYEGFYRDEIEERKIFEYPPFTKMVHITLSSKDPERLSRMAGKLHGELARILPGTFSIFHPTPPLFARIKDRHRMQIVIKGPSLIAFSEALKRLTFKAPKSVSVTILPV